MTADELAALIGWRSRTTVHHRVRRLMKLGVIVSYPWYQRPARWHNYRHELSQRIFALDRRHPRQMKIRTLGRALARGFPMPDPEVPKHNVKRPYFGPRSSMHPASVMNLFGDRDRACLLVCGARPCRNDPDPPIRRRKRPMGALSDEPIHL